ncbi:unnamed protein product [Oikopleura dioica]|uniref:Septin n=1 Tax=Oikopleura dioica TaxID=34765 RepID=E4WV59_OIKDI|nr:unnamed protein product [Oikopleura dioica]
MEEAQEKTVPLTNKVIKNQIESIREKIAEIKLPIVKSENDNHKFNTEKSQATPEKFDFPKDPDSSDVIVTKGGGLEMIGGFVGFANLPNQVHRKSVKKGFEFTMMAVGESGLGKSTLINSLFLTNLYEEREIPEAAIKAKQTVSIEASTVEIEERGVKLRLTVVDTPGFGDAIDNKNAFDPIIEYIDNQFERYLHDESGLNRRHIVDNRVHCCFYFINPCGHGLRPIDIEFMKTLQTRVNLVPLIAKADMLTPKEIKKFKKRVLEELGKNQIHIYQLPDVEDDEDEEFKQQTQQLKSMIPFAVVGSTQLIEVKGKKVRGRLYPWGVVEVENPDHNDFTGLRTMLISHMQDLQEVTHDLHYEKYRASRLGDEPEAPMMAPMGTRPPPDAEKDRILHEKEMELQKMQKMIEQMQMQLTLQQKASASADKNSKSHKV